MGGTGDMNTPGFQWFTQGFEDFAVKFRQFIEKKHALMRPADFSGAGWIATPDQCHGGSGVVRLPEWTLAKGFRLEFAD